MKIEMGESLFYSWLRHEKKCQIVQTNWKTSPRWDLQHEPELERLKNEVEEHFKYNVFKKNKGLDQIIRQGECDVLGISFGKDKNKFYAVDVAFHEGGLNYGAKDKNIAKIISKLTRTAICLYGYFDAKEAELIFGSPKIYPAILDKLTPCIDVLNEIFRSQGYDFNVRLIANDSFNEQVLQKVLLISPEIKDTSELFVRSYQLSRMFSKEDSSGKVSPPKESSETNSVKTEPVSLPQESNKEKAIGKLVQKELKPLIISNTTEEEIRQMQDKEYSKKKFGIQYPLLLKTSQQGTVSHYYKDPINIRGEQYRLCFEWYKKSISKVEEWIKDHQ